MATTATPIKRIEQTALRITAPKAVARRYRANEIADIVGVSTSTIWRWNAQGRMPKGRNLSPGVTVWDGAEIDAWLNSPKAA